MNFSDVIKNICSGYRAFIFTEHMYKISNISNAKEILTNKTQAEEIQINKKQAEEIQVNKKQAEEIQINKNLRMTKEIQLIKRLKEIKQNNTVTFYCMPISLRLYSYIDTDDEDEDEDAEDIGINSNKIINNILQIYLMQLKSLFLTKRLLQKNYFVLIRFIINHLSVNLSKIDRQTILICYDERIKNIPVPDSDDIIKKIIVDHFVN